MELRGIKVDVRFLVKKDFRDAINSYVGSIPKIQGQVKSIVEFIYPQLVSSAKVLDKRKDGYSAGRGSHNSPYI